MNPKKVTAIALTTSLLFSLSGCGDNATTSKGNNAEMTTYNMSAALDAPQYSSFINKQIDAVMNQLSSMMAIGKEVAGGDYLAESAISTAKQSISIIESAMKEVDIMIPPKQYEDTRTNTLKLMESSKNNIEKFIKELNEPSLNREKIYSLCSAMSGDFTALSSEFNVYYE